ncbi:MAG: site-specific integrase [Chloroflexi bacterium]|nr:site-specific integrase [Chloroflexota bacterium]
MARGSVIKRGDAWRVIVELPPDPATGKRRQRFETFSGSKREAEKRLTELLGLVDGQQLGASPKMTLAAYLERWLQDHAKAKAPKTYESYNSLLRAYVVPHLGNVPLGKLTTSHLVRLFTILREARRKDKQEGALSPATVAIVHRTLRAALNSAVKWQLLARSPMQGVAAPSVPKKEMRTFTVQQAQAFLGASCDEGLKWETFFNVWLTTGARPGELRALRWIDTNLESGIMSIQQTGQRIEKVGRVIGQPKTAGSRRPIALSPDVVVLLLRHKVGQNEMRLRTGPLWQDNNLVFPSDLGTMLESKQIHQAFTRICERANVPRIRPYDLRHSCASLLLAAGIHPKIVAERLGHSSVTLTLNTYSHVLPGLQQDAANTLQSLLRRKTS